MALIVKDRVREASTTTGTGTLTLTGAISGFQSFSAIGDANDTYYTIVNAATGDWEVGIGTYTASGTTLSRSQVLESSNGGALVNFGAGTKDVFGTYPADRSVSQADIGTAPNEIPLNQYLGSLAYQDAENIAGDVGVGGDLTVVGETFVNKITASTGILFGTDTSDANTLDDYEEGTWTPVLQGATAGSFSFGAIGTYTKIGRIVNVWFYGGNFDLTGAGISGFVELAGLPFSVQADNSGLGKVAVNNAVTANVIPKAYSGARLRFNLGGTSNMTETGVTQSSGRYLALALTYVAS